jgi:hypothetical protein
MKVRLNLATEPLESNRNFAVGATFLGSLGLIAMLLLSSNAYKVWHANTEIRNEQVALEADMDRLRAERTNLQAFFGRPDIVQKRERAAFLNNLIAQRAFPWTQIFMDLEHSLPAGVRVVSIEPRLAENHLELRLTVGASNDDVKLQFLKALEDSSEFSEIEVLSETRTARTGDADRVMLALQARYSAT